MCRNLSVGDYGIICHKNCSINQSQNHNSNTLFEPSNKRLTMTDVLDDFLSVENFVLNPEKKDLSKSNDALKSFVEVYLVDKITSETLGKLLSDSGLALLIDNVGNWESLPSDFLILVSCKFNILCSSSENVTEMMRRLLSVVHQLGSDEKTRDYLHNLLDPKLSLPQCATTTLDNDDNQAVKVFLLGLLRGDVDLLRRVILAMIRRVLQGLPSSWQQMQTLSRHPSDSITANDSSSRLLLSSCHLHLMASILDTLATALRHSDRIQAGESECALSLSALQDTGRRFASVHRQIIPLTSFCVRAALFCVSWRERPDLTYIMLQQGYKVHWAEYIASARDLESNLHQLVFARKHSKADMWKQLDPDWTDEGYSYVQLVSREESYQMLQDKPVGSFMLTPQGDDVPYSQFFLTFCVPGSVQMKTVVIRRDINNMSNPSSADSPDSAQSPSTSQTQTPAAVMHGKYLYRSNRYGPCANLMQTLRDISALLSTPLLFETPNTTTSVAVPLPGNSLFAPTLDLNAQLWIDTHHVLNRWTQTLSAPTNNTNGEMASPAAPGMMTLKLPLNNYDDDYDDDDDHDRDGDNSSSGDSASTTSDDNDDDDDHDDDGDLIDHVNGNKDDVARARAASKKAWKLQEVEDLVALNEAALALQALKTFLEQSAPVLSIIAELWTYNNHTSNNNSNNHDDDDLCMEIMLHDLSTASCMSGAQREHHLVALSRCAEVKEVQFLLNNNNNNTTSNNTANKSHNNSSNSSVQTQTFWPCLYGLLGVMDELQQTVHSMLMPALPVHVNGVCSWAQPLWRHVPTYDMCDVMYLRNRSKSMSICAAWQHREWLLVERLWQHVLQVVSVRSVRVSESLTGFGLNTSLSSSSGGSGSSGGEWMVPDCVAATDLMFVVSKWREMLLQKMQQKLRANKGAASSYASASASASAAAAYASAYGYGDDDGEPTSKEISYSAQDWQGARLFNHVVRLLNLDIQSDGAELMHKLVYWLYSRHALQEITKPGELAFSLPQVFYHYVEPWESRVLWERSQLRGRVLLGRQALHDPDTTTINDAYNWKKPGLFMLSSQVLQMEFAYPYTARVAAFLRLQDILSVCNNKRNSNGNNGNGNIGNMHTRQLIQMRQQDWQYHLLQLFELLRVEDAMVACIEQEHLHRLEPERLHEKLRLQELRHPPNQQSGGQTPQQGATSESGKLKAVSAAILNARGNRSSTGGIWQGHASAQTAYCCAVNRYLYKNALLSRVLLLPRHICFLQIDLYCLKEIITLLPVKPSANTSNSAAGNNSASANNAAMKRAAMTPTPPIGKLLSVAEHNTMAVLAKSFSSNNLSSFFHHTGASAQQQQQQMMMAAANYSNANSDNATTTTASNTGSNSAPTTPSSNSNATAGSSVVINPYSTQQVYGANMGQSLNAYTLTPSHAALHGHTMEVYAVVRLVKQSVDTRAHNSNNSNNNSSNSNSSGSNSNNSGNNNANNSNNDGGILQLISSSINSNNNNITITGSKVNMDGAQMTSVMKIEPVHAHHRTASSAAQTNNSNNTASNTSGNRRTASNASNTSNAPTMHKGGRYGQQTLAQISVAIDYDWRTQSIFRFPLPEGWLHLLQRDTDPTNNNNNNNGNNGKNSSNNSSNNNGNSDIRTMPPLKICIAIFERSFFSDTKIGEVEIPLEEVSDRHAVHDWFPVVSDNRSVSWMLYAQTKLRFPLMHSEALAAEDGPLAPPRRTTSKQQQIQQQQHHVHSQPSTARSKGLQSSTGMGSKSPSISNISEHSNHSTTNNNNTTTNTTNTANNSSTPSGSGNAAVHMMAQRGLESFQHLADRFIRSSGTNNNSSSSGNTPRIHIPPPSTPNFSAHARDDPPLTHTNNSNTNSNNTSANTSNSSNGPVVNSGNSRQQLQQRHLSPVPQRLGSNGRVAPAASSTTSGGDGNSSSNTRLGKVLVSTMRSQLEDIF